MDQTAGGERGTLLGLGLVQRRPARLPADHEDLLRVYAEARRPELALFGFDAEQLETFVRMQFELQQRDYAHRYPDAEHSVIELDGELAGQWRVWRGPEHVVLVDIALLPAFRNRGLGTRLLMELAVEAEERGVPLSLSVRPDNPARRLYERLGFVAARATPTNVEMVRHPKPVAAAREV